MGTGRGFPRLTLLSPTPERLTRLFKVWDRELAKMAKAEELKLPKPLPRAAFAPDLTALAEKKTAKDRSVANGSSIALLLEHRGASVLLAADAVEPVFTRALRAVAQNRARACRCSWMRSSSAISAARPMSPPNSLGVCRPGTMS